MHSSYLLMTQFLWNWYWQWRILALHDGGCWISGKLKNSHIFHAFWDCREGRRKTTECNRQLTETCAACGEVKSEQGRGKRCEKLRLCNGKADNIILIEYGRVIPQETVLGSDTCSDLFQESHNLQVYSSRNSESSSRQLQCLDR